LFRRYWLFMGAKPLARQAMGYSKSVPHMGRCVSSGFLLLWQPFSGRAWFGARHPVGRKAPGK
jgi:hypothetical protein